MADAKRRVIPVEHDYVLPRARSIVKMFEIGHTRTGDIQPARPLNRGRRGPNLDLRVTSGRLLRALKQQRTTGRTHTNM